jgi:carbonic anhydrase
MSMTDELLAANARFVATFAGGDLPMPPKRRVAVVTCMDARILPSRILGLEMGDAHVIRNAGGRAVEALRSLVISQRLLGTTEVMVIHHTDCGMLTFDNAALREKVRTDLGQRAAALVKDTDFLPFTDVEQSVRDDVAWLRASPLIPDSTPVRGFVYDVRRGTVVEVDASAGARSSSTATSRPVTDDVSLQ